MLLSNRDFQASQYADFNDQHQENEETEEYIEEYAKSIEDDTVTTDVNE